jgi:hypothetical protein
VPNALKKQIRKNKDVPKKIQLSYDRFLKGIDATVCSIPILPIYLPYNGLILLLLLWRAEPCIHCPENDCLFHGRSHRRGLVWDKTLFRTRGVSVKSKLFEIQAVFSVLQPSSSIGINSSPTDFGACFMICYHTKLPRLLPTE